jgi:hypothetical protein
MKAHPSTIRILLGTAALALAAQHPLVAQTPEPFAFADDDLLLGVQATGGTGSTSNLFFNLGKTTDFLANGNRGVLGNIAVDMENTFDSNWFERADLWFGVVGNRSNLSPGFPTFDTGGPGQDPGRTWYVSVAAAAPGAGLAWAGYNSSSLGTGGTNFKGMKGLFLTPTTGEGLLATEAGAAILNQFDHPVGWNNSWSKWNPTPGAGFALWTGGVQNRFGQGGSSVLVDVQRVVANTAGTYVTTIAIESDGTIRATTQGSSGNAYETWAAAQGLDGSPGKEAGFADDPEGDSLPNGIEWILGGDPLAQDAAEVGADFSGDSADGLTLVFEREEDSIGVADLFVDFDSDLDSPWAKSVAIGATSSGPDANGVTVTINTAASPDIVTVHIPASNAPGGRIFAALRAVLAD